MSCSSCYFCKYTNGSSKKRYKCDVHPNKRFNIRVLHGWFCKLRRKI